MVSQDAVQQAFNSLKGQAADIIGNVGRLTELVGNCNTFYIMPLKPLALAQAIFKPWVVWFLITQMEATRKSPWRQLRRSWLQYCTLCLQLT